MAMPRRKRIREVSFVYTGQVPSKSNFRRGGKNWREQWSRIKEAEKKIAELAFEAGGKGMPRGGEVQVDYKLYNQRIDGNNAWKILADAMQGVCYDDDKLVTKGTFECFKDKGGGRMDVTVRLRD